MMVVILTPVDGIIRWLPRGFSCSPAWTLGQGMKKPVAGCYGRLTRWKGGGDVVYMALL